MLSNPQLYLEDRQIDRGVVRGLGLSFLLLFVAIAASGQMLNFFNVPAILVVFGGTLGASLVNYSAAELSLAWESLMIALMSPPPEPMERIRYLVKIGHAAKQGGILVLEPEAERAGDEFLRKAFEITVDGQPAEEIRRMLETEAITSNDRAMRLVQILQTMGQFAPAMGLIGTLVGLIEMLGALDKPSAIAPAMAVSLVTTLYGAVLANLVLLPLAGKIKNRNADAALVKALTIEGVLAIGRQESPIVIEQRLRSFLPSGSPHV